MPSDLHDLDWEEFTPHKVMTLLFVVREGEVLLIDKKTGFGAGRVDGPGGHVDPGENPADAARREFREEVGAEALNVQPAGTILFHDVQGLNLLIHVFRGDGVRGTARATPEATPRWTPLDHIPFDEMWPDDKHWFPYLLRHTGFCARVLYDGEVLLGAHVAAVEVTRDGLVHPPSINRAPPQ